MSSDFKNSNASANKTISNLLSIKFFILKNKGKESFVIMKLYIRVSCRSKISAITSVLENYTEANYTNSNDNQSKDHLSGEVVNASPPPCYGCY